MNQFIEKFQPHLSGVLTGFDRLVFRGTLGLNHETGMLGYLWANHLGLKDFGTHAEQMSKRVRESSLGVMRDAGRPIHYLNSGQQDKQKIALAIAAADNIGGGPICALSAVELCTSYAVVGDRTSHRLRLERRFRKCLFIYQYWLHPLFGFMSMRLQTWFPFGLHIYLNGRLWLAQQMDKIGLAYRRYHNCFTWMEDFTRAQQLMDAQIASPWTEWLDGLVPQIHPAMAELTRNYPMKYYWTCQDSEWALDLIFRNPEQLAHLYPQLLHLGMITFSSSDVLRFMGKKVTRHGTATGQHQLEVSSDLKVRPHGVRMKHRYGANSIKLYDKAYDQLGAVLRSEITITDTHLFRTYRPPLTDPSAAPRWLVMGRGLADFQRRAEVSQKAVDCYCDALAAVDETATLQQLTALLERRVRWHGKSVRAIHPFQAEDYALLKAVNRGEFAIHGLRNRDLQAQLYGTPAGSPAEQRRRSAAISRKLRLLRAHGLIHKLPHTHRYRVSQPGRIVLNAILSAYRMTAKQLASAA